MACTTTPARGANVPVPEPSSSGLTAIGVGIDTARYGHVASFMRPDRQKAAPKLLVMENQAGYQALRARLELLHQQHPQAHFHIRIDAAGQYANNFERFLRGLTLPMTISIGEPKRNHDYQKAHFPKRQTDETESLAMARFAVVEQPAATHTIPEEMVALAEVAGRLQAQVKQATQTVNRLHNLLARVFPELASLTNNVAAAWALELLSKYPSAAKIGQARLSALKKIPYLSQDKAETLIQAARQSVGSLRGPVAETLVRQLVDEVRHSQNAEDKLRDLLHKTFKALPADNHRFLETIAGIGSSTAAILVAKIIDINRFATPEALVGYFGIFPEESSSGVDKQGRPLPLGTMVMSRRGNDLVRTHLWMAALSGIRSNPALRALYRRLKTNGKRGDVALGHCMRKLLHLVFAVWKTGKPFDPNHYPWIQEGDTTAVEQTAVEQTVVLPALEAAATETPALPLPANSKAVGHKREQVPAKQVVTTAGSSVERALDAVNPPLPTAPARPNIDYAYLRRQVTMEQVLEHLGILSHFKGTAQQRRGPCPVHTKGNAPTRTGKATCSVHLGKNIFQCFQVECGAQGNVLDLWAAMHQLPLYDAALHLAATFHLARNREEEPVPACQRPTTKTGSPGVVITTNDP